MVEAKFSVCVCVCVFEIKPCDHFHQSFLSTTFPVVLFIKLYKEVLTFRIVYEVLKCDNSNASF